jgi:hypothetical protein
MVTPSSAVPSSETVGVEPESLQRDVRKGLTIRGDGSAYLSLDLLPPDSVREMFRSMSLKPGTEPAELVEWSVLESSINREGAHLVPECSRFQEPLDLDEGMWRLTWTARGPTGVMAGGERARISAAVP